MEEEKQFLNNLLDDREFEAISMKLLLRDGHQNLGNSIEDPDKFRELVRDDIIGGILVPFFNNNLIADDEEQDDIETLARIYMKHMKPYIPTSFIPTIIPILGKYSNSPITFEYMRMLDEKRSKNNQLTNLPIKRIKRSRAFPAFFFPEITQNKQDSLL